MKKIINVRGCNASGKTTTVRQFIEKYTRAEIGLFEGSWVTRCTPNVFVLGRYDRKNGGCDGYSGRDEVIGTIIGLIKTFHPSVIIYEGILYSKTTLFAQDVEKRAKSLGYEWEGIYLHRNLKSVFDNLEARNNGATYNPSNIINGYKSVQSSYNRLKDAGYNIKLIDVDNIPFEQMGNILNDAISESGDEPWK